MRLVLGCTEPHPGATAVTSIGVALEYHPESLAPLQAVQRVPTGTQTLYAFFCLKAEYYWQGEYLLYRDRQLYDNGSFAYKDGYNSFKLTPKGEASFGAGYYRIVFRNTDDNAQIGAQEFRVEKPTE